MKLNHLAYKPTIALLTDWLPIDIWSGVMQAAQTHHQNLLTVVEGLLRRPFTGS